MADKEEAPVAQVTTDADGDQTAKPVAETAEPAIASEAARDDASKRKTDEKERKADAKPASSKPKATPAKPEAGENQQPAERTSGRRERKQTSFFQPEKKTETEKLEIKEGQGTKLTDIPNVAFHLGKMTGRDELLEDLHQILYGRKGKLSTRKRDIQAFSGFSFSDEQQDTDLEKAKSLLSRFKNDHMTRLLDLLDIPRSDLKEKDAKVQKVLEFLQAPSKQSDKDLAAKEADKKAAAARKRQRKEKEKEGKSSAAKAKRAKKSKDASGDAEEGEAEEAGVDDEEEAAAGGEEEDEDDEKPLGSVATKPKAPTEEELENEIVQTLSGVNVLEFNIKMLMKHLNEKYKMDLSGLKPFIKTVAIQYCNEHAPKLDAPQDQA